MKTLEKLAEDFGEDALVFHWQPRLKAEKEGTAPYAQLTTVKDCYSYGYASGWRACREAMLKIPSDKLMRMELNDLANFGELGGGDES